MGNTKSTKKTVSINKTKAIKPIHYYAATTSIINKDAAAKEAHAKKHHLTKNTKIGLLIILVAIPIIAGLVALVLALVVK